MGHQAEQGYDGTALEVHSFDSELQAQHYVKTSRGYTYDRHEPWAFTSGIDLYKGPDAGQMAAIRPKGKFWTASFWTEKK